MNKKTKKSAGRRSAEEFADGQEDLPEISLQHQGTEDGLSRDEIALQTLERYAGCSIDEFQDFILLTNFPHYVDTFSKITGAEVLLGTVLKSAHYKKERISIIDYRVGAPMAALIVDVLSYLKPQCVVMLGLCGGLHHRHEIGDFLLPMAAIRDEGASLHYMPPQVPSLPAFLVQQFISEELMEQKVGFKTGVIHTTDYRMWEFDEEFQQRLREEKATAIDMECSALFITGFSRKVPIGALMLISDLPTQPNGIKTSQLAREVLDKYTEKHLKLGIASLIRMRNISERRKINFRRFHF